MSAITTKQKTNYTRLSRAVLDLCTEVFRDILVGEILPTNIQTELSNHMASATPNKIKLSREEINKITRAHTQGYSEFDISLLYGLIRYLCTSVTPPTQGWGKTPQLTEQTTGDDIERIRNIHNSIFGHIADTSIPDRLFNHYWTELENIMIRMSGKFGKSYDQDLAVIKSWPMDDVLEKKYMDAISELEKLNKERTDAIKRDPQNNCEFEKHNVIGNGSSAIVFRGKFQERPAAIKRIKKEYWRKAETEIKHLLKIDKHENILRYLYQFDDDDYIYIVLELAKGHLKDVVRGKISTSLSEKEIYQQLLHGLCFLHQQRIVHRDIKPENVLLVEIGNRDVVKLGDFGLVKTKQDGHGSISLTHGKSIGTCGYIAPEIYTAKQGDKTSENVDIFSAAVTIFCYHTKGKSHPFENPKESAEDYDQFQENISQGIGPFMEEYVKILKGNDELYHLLTQMLQLNPTDRPSASMSLQHIFFWDYDKQRNFICSISDGVEPRHCCSNADAKCLATKLESNSHCVIGNDWLSTIDCDIQRDLLSGRNSNHDKRKVKALIRAFRNLSHHIDSQSSSTQSLFGRQTQSQIEYIKEKFPKLLLHLYETIQNFIAGYTGFEVEQNEYLKSFSSFLK